MEKEILELFIGLFVQLEKKTVDPNRTFKLYGIIKKVNGTGAKSTRVINVARLSLQEEIKKGLKANLQILLSFYRILQKIAGRSNKNTNILKANTYKNLETQNLRKSKCADGETGYHKSLENWIIMMKEQNQYVTRTQHRSDNS